MVSLDYLFSSKDEKPVYARDGWVIPTELAAEPMVGEVGMRNLSNEYLRKLPQGNKIRSYSLHQYNCVGMIFSSRRKSISIDHIYDIFRHDGYRKIERHEVSVGDVVLYKKNNIPTHVALITQIVETASILNIKTLSKWGALAEFEHFIEDVLVSEIGHPAEYWTEKVL